jgi:hypothetical protein
VRAVTIAPELEAEILRCYQVEKTRANTIARKLNVHLGTVKRVLAQAGLSMTDQHTRPSQLDPFLPFIRQTLAKFPTHTASRLLVKVRERGYSGGPDHFRHVLSRHRPRLKPELCAHPNAQGGKQSRVEQEKSRTKRARHLPRSAHTLRLERSIRPALQVDANAADNERSFPVPADPSFVQACVQPNWSREFTIPGKYSLEQLSEIILHLLGWAQRPLYQFLIANRVHAHLVSWDADDFCIAAKTPCLSCDIPIRLLDLTIGSMIVCIFDFTNCPFFRITVLGIRTETAKVIPTLLSYRGKNIIKDPGTMCKAESTSICEQDAQVRSAATTL